MKGVSAVLVTPIWCIMVHDNMVEAFEMFYRVTIQVDSNLLLTSKHKFCFSMKPMYKNATFVLVSQEV